MSTENDERQIDERQIAGMNEKQKAIFEAYVAYRAGLADRDPPYSAEHGELMSAIREAVLDASEPEIIETLEMAWRAKMKVEAPALPAYEDLRVATTLVCRGEPQDDDDDEMLGDGSCILARDGAGPLVISIRSADARKPQAHEARSLGALRDAGACRLAS
jgi:hypothetical protein